MTSQAFECEAVFVIGSGRCGTTFLAQTLQGDRVRCLREGQVQSRFEEFGNRHLFNLLYTGEISGTEFSRYFVESRSRLVGGLRGNEIYCEKIPHGQWAIDEMLRAFPKARFIELFRDGRDVVNSMLLAKWYDSEGDSRWTPRGDSEWWHRLGQFEKCCVRLKMASACTVLNRLLLPASMYYSVAYERLVTEFPGVLAELEAFIGVDLYRGHVEVKPHIGGWLSWHEDRLVTYRSILGLTGLRCQAALGYDD